MIHTQEWCILYACTKFEVDCSIPHGPWKKPLDFDGSLDHVALGLVMVRRGQVIPCNTGYVLPGFFV